jgi:hypothetical protein
VGNDSFGNVVAIECCIQRQRSVVIVVLGLGLGLGDFEPDPALQIHEAATGPVSQTPMVVGGLYIPCGRGSGRS